VQEEAEHRGGERLLGDPALARGEARIAARVGAPERRVQSVERGQALAPSSGDELLGTCGGRALPQVAEPVAVVDDPLGLAALPQRTGKVRGG
jgi:hypothetical protein